LYAEGAPIFFTTFRPSVCLSVCPSQKCLFDFAGCFFLDKIFLIFCWLFFFGQNFFNFLLAVLSKKKRRRPRRAPREGEGGVRGVSPR